MQKTPKKETSNVHEWLSVYKPFVSHSNSLITCLFKPSARSNNLVTRSLETSTHSNGLVTHLLKPSVGHPFIGNIRPFQRLGHPFIRNIILFEQLSHPFIWNIRPFELPGHLSVPFKQLGHYWIPWTTWAIFCGMMAGVLCGIPNAKWIWSLVISVRKLCESSFRS